MKVYTGKLSKKVSVKLIGEAEESFNALNLKVGEQRKKGIETSKEIALFTAIEKMVDIISANPFYGENAKKSLIPKSYIMQYDITNIFIADLPDYWRLVYTLESDEVEIIAFVLDIFDHDSYNKKFGFRKK
jgi:Txe/YoeB family toxin of Txe-Axe toxin-antitoxin module